MPSDTLTKRTLLGALPSAGLALTATGGALAQSSSPAEPSSGRAQAPAASKPRIVALEEHVMFPDFVGCLAETRQYIRADLFDRVAPILSDFGERRVLAMSCTSRSASPVPALAASHASHRLLSLIPLGMPVSGHLISAAGGHPVTHFGLFTIPGLPRSEAADRVRPGHAAADGNVAVP